MISKSEVLEILENVFKKYNMTWDKNEGFAKEVPESIKNIPTAYDVDKVVEQLENFIEDAKSQGDWSHIKPFQMAIETVKAGGTNDNY